MLSGGRGVLREVYIGGDLNINSVRNFPSAELKSVVDRLYRDSQYDTPQFGENVDFTQRYTGFFVPPRSDLYTFNLRSDDQSRLYFSTNASTTELPDTPLISVREHTRSRYMYIDCESRPCNNHNMCVIFCGICALEISIFFWGGGGVFP